MSKYKRANYIPYGMLPEQIDEFEDIVNNTSMDDNIERPLMFKSIDDIFNTNLKSYESIIALDLWFTRDMTHSRFYEIMRELGIHLKEEVTYIAGLVDKESDYNMMHYIRKVYYRYEDIGVFRRFVRLLLKLFSRRNESGKLIYDSVFDSWWLLPLAEYIARDNITKLTFRPSELRTIVKKINDEILSEWDYDMELEIPAKFTCNEKAKFKLLLFRRRGATKYIISNSPFLYTRRRRIHLLNPKENN